MRYEASRLLAQRAPRLRGFSCVARPSYGTAVGSGSGSIVGSGSSAGGGSSIGTSSRGSESSERLAQPLPSLLLIRELVACRAPSRIRYQLRSGVVARKTISSPSLIPPTRSPLV